MWDLPRLKQCEGTTEELTKCCLQAGAVIRIQLDREAIDALQLGICAASVRASILASKFHKSYKLKPQHIT